MKSGDRLRVLTPTTSLDARFDGWVRLGVFQTPRGQILAYQNSEGLWYDLQGRSLLIETPEGTKAKP